jgi:uncharacterized protein YndB with AHSA1/START domain
MGVGKAKTAEAAAAGKAPRPSRNDLVLTRVFEAPRERVFRAWSEPERLARWWGPHGFTNPVCEADVRPGGAIHIVMRGPDGVDYPMTGVFHEVAAPERLVFSTYVGKEGEAVHFEVRITVTFAEHEGGTKLTLRAHVVKETPDAARYLAGMEQGWTQSLERLAQSVAAA